MRGRTRYMLALSHNGQAYRTVEAAELVSAGYQFDATGPCFALLKWADLVRPVVCDAPMVSMPMPSVKDAAKAAAPVVVDRPPS